MIKGNSAVHKDRVVSILLVDDDFNFLDAARRLLERMGYMVTSANSSDQAISLMKSFLFDIVVTDYSMPGTNGIQLALQANKLTVPTPIILYTGRIEPFDGNLIAESGITEIVRKPLSIKDLDIAIKKVLKQDEEIDRNA